MMSRLCVEERGVLGILGGWDDGVNGSASLRFFLGVRGSVDNGFSVYYENESSRASLGRSLVTSEWSWTSSTL